MDKEESFTLARLQELAQRCYQRNICTCSDFLNLNEQDCFLKIVEELPPVKWHFIGGLDYVERKIIQFIPEFLEENDKEVLNALPFVYLKIKPVNCKFAEQLTHRDVLGALMNLGIERRKIGDILVDNGQQIIYVITVKSLGDFLLENLSKIKHTLVKCEISVKPDFCYEPEFEEIHGTVASVRLDSVSSLAFRISRTKMNQLIEEGMVFVNGKRITSNGYTLKEKDIVSVRRIGRYLFEGEQTITKKGRLFINLKKYI